MKVVALEYFCICQLETLPEWLLFLSPEGVTPDVCVKQNEQI
jgi:hypothetical protein